MSQAQTADPPIEGESQEDDAGSTQRLRSVLRHLTRVDVNSPDLKQTIETLKVKAEHALRNHSLQHQFGSVNLPKARQVASDKRKEEMERRHAELLPIIDGIRKKGPCSLKDIASALDAMGIPTSHGGKWSTSSVRWIEQSRKR